MLLKIFENIRFLACQELPLRGDGDESDSNFVQLFKLRSADDSSMLQWLQRGQTSTQVRIYKMRF